MQNYDFSEELQKRVKDISNKFQGMTGPSGWETALKVLVGGVLLGIFLNWLMKKFYTKDEQTTTYTTGFPLIQTTKAPVHGVIATKTSPFEPASVCTF